MPPDAPPAPSHPGAAAARGGQVKLGFFPTGSHGRTDLEEWARWGAQNGYQALDVPADRDGTRAVAERHGLAVAATSGMHGEPLTADDAERQRQVALIERAIDRAATQGIPSVSVGHRRDPNVDARENLRLFRLAYEPLARRAETRGVRLVFENWPRGGRNFMITPELWDAAFEAVPSPALGLVFDPSHLVWQGIDYRRALRDFGQRVYHAHAKDTELLAEGAYRSGVYGPQLGAGPSFWRYRLPGFGVVDWPRYVDTLHAVGYDGVLSVEHEDGAWGFPDGDAERFRRGLLLARNILAPLVV